MYFVKLPCSKYPKLCVFFHQIREKHFEIVFGVRGIHTLPKGKSLTKSIIQKFHNIIYTMGSCCGSTKKDVSQSKQSKEYTINISLSFNQEQDNVGNSISKSDSNQSNTIPLLFTKLGS